MDDRAEGAEGARADHHAVGEERSAGDGGHPVAIVVIVDLARLAQRHGEHVARLAGDPGQGADLAELFVLHLGSGVEHQRGRIELLQIDVHAEFLLEHGLGRGADGQVQVAARGQQDLHQSHAVGDSAGAGQGDHDVAFHGTPT